MRQTLVFILACALVGCSTTSQAPAAKRTLPEPLVAANLPPTPDEESPVPAEANWAVALEAGDAAQRAGILLSQEKAARAARYVVRYDELRGLYLIDLRTWGRERQIYERYLELADEELRKTKKEAERSWFERNAGPIGLTLGVVIGITASAIGAAAIDKAAN